MTRVLYLQPEHERFLELAARYLRTLCAVEYAHALEDSREVAIVLASIDPVDVKMVGQELELLRSLYRTAPTLIGTEPRAVDGNSPPSGEHRSEVSQLTSSVPSSFFPESRKVPCE